MVCIHTENQNWDFYPFVLHEISVLVESPLGHLCYLLTDVPPQPNSGWWWGSWWNNNMTTSNTNSCHPYKTTLTLIGYIYYQVKKGLGKLSPCLKVNVFFRVCKQPQIQVYK